MSEIKNQFTGLPINELLIAPIVGAAEGQTSLAKSTVDFIQNVGFDPEGNTRVADFSFNRNIITGKDDKGNDIIEQELVSLDVPLITIVPIPCLLIDEVDITFDMEVKSSTSDTLKVGSKVGLEVSAGGGFAGFTASVKVTGSVSVNKENTRKTDNSAKYHIKVHASQAGIPEGMLRVFDIINSAISPNRVGGDVNKPARKAA